MESGKTHRKRDRAARSSRSSTYSDNSPKHKKQLTVYTKNYYANLENVSDLSSESETEQIVDTTNIKKNYCNNKT